MADVTSKASWKLRKEGLDGVLAILDGAGRRIKYNIGSELLPGLKARLADTNRNLAVSALEILGVLATSIGKPFDKSSRFISASVIGCLSDNKVSVRGAAIGCLDAFVNACGIESMLGFVGSALMTEQSIMRKELLKWVVEKFDAGILKDKKNVELVGLVHPTLVCLGDRNGDVRKSAVDFLRHLIGFVGYGVVKEKSCDLFSGTLLSSITPLIEAARPAVAENPKAVVAAAVRPKTPAKNRSSKIIVEKSVPIEAVVETGSSFPLLNDDPKQKDYRTGQDRGASKWTFDCPRKEMVDFLAEQCEKCVASDVCKLMFSVDHYKERDFLAALGMFCDGMAEEGDVKRAMFIANADLVLKYITLRFFDTGTSMLIKCLEVVEGMLKLMDDAGYHLSEYEASCFLPFFVNKVWDC